MANETSSYKSIFRGMSVFGGVQIFQILINLVRGKFIAIFLGPAGSGMSALFYSSASSLQQLTSLGLPMALTREIAVSKDDDTSIQSTIKAGRVAIRLTALIGFIVCIAGSWLISDMTFGNHHYSGYFALMSIAIALSMLWAGDQAILQGLREIKLLSRATLFSSIIGLVAGVPLYWLIGTDGIVPAMVVAATSMYIFYRVALNRSRYKPADNIKTDWCIVRRMASFGIILMSGQVIGSIAIYMANVFIRATGSMEDLGNYQAANSICAQYVGMIFASMAMDYFPRLTSSINDDTLWKSIVNRQTQLVVLLSAPLTILLIATAPLVIKVLLTDSYSPAIPLIRWMGAAIFLQSVSYPMGYVTFAKGNKRLYFWIEGIIANVVFLLSICMCYMWLGIIGLGVAAVIRYATDIIIYYTVNKKVYGFSYSKTSIATVIENGAYVSTALLVSLYIGGLSALICGIILAIPVSIRTVTRMRTLLKLEKQ